VETSVTTIAALAVEAAARLRLPMALPTWRLEFNKLEWVIFMQFFECWKPEQREYPQIDPRHQPKTSKIKNYLRIIA
jgi:hypothetical protein